MTKSDTKTKKKNELIYVIAGEDESLVNLNCQQLLDKLIEPSQRATGLFDADPNRVSISEILDELRTAPFLSDKRIVLIKRADKFISNNRDLLEKYFDNPSPTGILILTVNSWDARTKLAKKLANSGKLITVTQPKGQQLQRCLIDYARQAHDKKLTQNAAEILVEFAGDELPRLYSEVDKLAIFADAEKVVDVSHIESLIGHNRIYGAFAVIDACLAGDAAGAISRLRNMFAEDRSAEYTVVGAFAFHFRRMFNAKVLLKEGHNPYEIAGKLRIWGNKDGFFTMLGRMSLEQIGAALQKLAAIDYAIKTGQTKAEVAIEQLVLELNTGSGGL
jgi:DNA polymerase-3 subunit delta